jgi:hypothetical protein
LNFRDWNFWVAKFGADVVEVRVRTPYFEDDEGINAVSMETTIEDYMEYLQLVEAQDKDCSDEKALEYPRVQVSGWSPFATGSGRSLYYDLAWNQLVPRDIRESMDMWVETMFRDGDLESICGSHDRVYIHSKFQEISISMRGATSRLRVENFSASVCFSQVVGSTIFFLFPPQDGAKLYAQKARQDETRGAMLVSPVDVFYPNATLHARFLEVKAQVAFLRKGEMIVLPAGWWYTTFTTEPAVLFKYRYWSPEHRLSIVDELWASYGTQEMHPDEQNAAVKCFRNLRDVLAKVESK